MIIDLSGRTVLVTGASRGIGAAIARQLAAAGARVAVHYGHNRAAAQKLADELGNGAHVFGQDLADAAGCETLWKVVQEHFGKVDALINNAGIAVPSPLDTSTTQWVAHWNQTMAVNLTSAGVLSRAAIAHFRAHGGGRIVNVASRAAFRGDQPDYLAYAASKAGMVALTRSSARVRQRRRDGLRARAGLHTHGNGARVHRQVRSGHCDEGHRAHALDRARRYRADGGVPRERPRRSRDGNDHRPQRSVVRALVG